MDLHGRSAGGERMKIIRIEKCGECPYFNPHHWQCYEDYDQREDRYINDLHIIPFWCPLEDAEVKG